jgi:dienelactone hydrolase
MKAFRDRTGLPGPRSWSSQEFPPALADHPVTGVSWYEAAAYAAFRGKELPTIFQWEKAARNGNVAPPFNNMPWGVLFPGDSLRHRANFDGATTSPVTENPFGVSPFGAYNMAGNVAEWCQNGSSAGFFTSGGAFGDPPYMFARYGTFPGFYSSDRLGFRCARRRAPESAADASAMRIEISTERPKYVPTTTARFDELRSYYRYDETPLSASIVERSETPDWTRETIAFAGADGERAVAYLYLPIHAARPVQLIHFLPGTGVETGVMGLQSNMEAVVGACVRGGRAMFGVALRGYQERRDAGGGPEPAVGTAEFRDKIVNWVTDLRRGLDYLVTRTDVDLDRLAFVGQSSGARIGITLAAVEPRYRSVFFHGAGVVPSQANWVSGTNPIEFAPHIEGPTMMLQGRFDEAIRLKTSAEPLFALLPEPKRLVLYDGGHMATTELFVKELNAWLDETLGPVRR